MLAPQVGTTAWNQALGQKVVWMVHGEQQSASLTLNPPDLGPLQVVLSVNNGHADAAFYAHQPEVRQALEAALPTLRDMMGGAGIQLGQATVNAGTPDQRQAQQQMQQGPRSLAGNDRSNEVIAPLPRQTSVSGVGLVDTFA
jgi:flagellar hook-length control protein FliK